MDSLIECVLRNTITEYNKLFGKNCTFVDFETDAENFNWSTGFQSGARFGRILYDRGDGTVVHSDHLVLKVTPSIINSKQFSMLQFFNEIIFYTRIEPFFETIGEDIRHLFSTYYGSVLQYNVSTDEAVIVFENLQAKGYLPSVRRSFLDYDHLSLMLRKLGEFHAYSYRARERNPKNFYELSRCMVETNAYVLKHVDSYAVFLPRSTEPILSDPDYYSKRKGVLDMIESCDDILRAVYKDGDKNNRTHVLCHGDYLRNNVLFKYNDHGKPIDLKIVDLARWRFASPAIDITLVLYFNADQKMRDEHWDDLIDDYYEALRSTFPTTIVPSKEAIVEEFKTAAITSYFIASSFLPQMITDDVKDIPPVDLLPEEYKNSKCTQIPLEIVDEVCTKEGEKLSTTALIDVLKDVIDRGFL